MYYAKSTIHEHGNLYFCLVICLATWREIGEDKIAVCEKKLPDLNSACFEVLVSMKIFQFQDMHSENHFLCTIRGHNVATDYS